MERRGPSHLGPYGQACISCFKGKSKCVARPDGPGCQRCHRLSKPCQPSDQTGRRTIQKKQQPNTRIADLEKQVEILTSQLQSRQALTSGEPQHPRPPASQAIASKSRYLLPNDLVAVNQGDDEDGTGTIDPSATTGSREHESTSDLDIATILNIFRSRMLPQFPFIHLPSQMTVSRLQRERPFLLRSIAYVVSQRDNAAQLHTFKLALSEALLSEEINKTELLLSLLIYISWAWDHSKIVPRLMMQAVALACEHDNSHSQSMDSQMRAVFMPGLETYDSSSFDLFLEHQRAVLACFVLSSAVSGYFGQVETLRWTSQMDEGLAALGANHECPTDAFLAVQVRLQRLGQKASHIKYQHKMEQGRMQRPAETASSPALASLAMLQGELQSLQNSLSPTKKRPHLAHISTTELIIGQSRHSVNSMVPFMLSHFSVMTASSTAGNGPSTQAERTSCLWQCVKSIKTYTDTLRALPASEFAGISFVQWAQIAYCCSTLNCLTTTIADPSWDRAAVRAIIDTPVLIDCVAEKLELAAGEAGEQEPKTAFTRIAAQFRILSSELRVSSTREHVASEDVIARSKVFGGAMAWDTGSIEPGDTS